MATGQYDRTKALISLHVPKTAGTSLRAQLQSWFGQDNLFFHYRGAGSEFPGKTALRSGLCIHGHFNRLRGCGALEYYPEATQFLIVLRHPFDRFVSQWNYLHASKARGIRVAALNDSPSFDLWFQRRQEASERGDDPFSFLAHFPTVPDAADATSVFRHNFLAVGITEHYYASLCLFAAVLGFAPPSDEMRLNVGNGVEEDLRSYRAPHESAFPQEYAVYHEGMRIFRKQQSLRSSVGVDLHTG